MAVLSGLAVAETHAATVAYEFVATVSNSYVGADATAWFPWAAIGETLVGTIHLDTDGGPELLAHPGIGSYALDGAANWLSVNIGGAIYELRGATTQVDVWNNSFPSYATSYPDGQDYYQVHISSAEVQMPGFGVVPYLGTFSFNFIDEGDAVLTSEAYVGPLGAFTNRSLQLDFSGLHGPFWDNNASFQATLTSISAVAAVPLPAGLPLLAGALGGLGLIGWRRRRCAASAVAA